MDTARSKLALPFEIDDAYLERGPLVGRMAALTWTKPSSLSDFILMRTRTFGKLGF
jgi:hypothetical protein